MMDRIEHLTPARGYADAVLGSLAWLLVVGLASAGFFVLRSWGGILAVAALPAIAAVLLAYRRHRRLRQRYVCGVHLGRGKRMALLFWVVACLLVMVAWVGVAPDFGWRSRLSPEVDEVTKKLEDVTDRLVSPEAKLGSKAWAEGILKQVIVDSLEREVVLIRGEHRLALELATELKQKVQGPDAVHWQPWLDDGVRIALAGVTSDLDRLRRFSECLRSRVKVVAEDVSFFDTDTEEGQEVIDQFLPPGATTQEFEKLLLEVERARNNLRSLVIGYNGEEGILKKVLEQGPERGSWPPFLSGLTADGDPLGSYSRPLFGWFWSDLLKGLHPPAYVCHGEFRVGSAQFAHRYQAWADAKVGHSKLPPTFVSNLNTSKSCCDERAVAQGGPAMRSPIIGLRWSDFTTPEFNSEGRGHLKTRLGELRDEFKRLEGIATGIGELSELRGKPPSGGPNEWVASAVEKALRVFLTERVDEMELALQKKCKCSTSQGEETVGELIEKVQQSLGELEERLRALSMLELLIEQKPDLRYKNGGVGLSAAWSGCLRDLCKQLEGLLKDNNMPADLEKVISNAGKLRMEDLRPWMQGVVDNGASLQNRWWSLELVKVGADGDCNEICKWLLQASSAAKELKVAHDNFSKYLSVPGEPKRTVDVIEPSGFLKVLLGVLGWGGKTKIERLEAIREDLNSSDVEAVWKKHLADLPPEQRNELLNDLVNQGVSADKVRQLRESQRQQIEQLARREALESEFSEAYATFLRGEEPRLKNRLNEAGREWFREWCTDNAYTKPAEFFKAVTGSEF